MPFKNFQFQPIKQEDQDKGELSVVFATFNVKDHDGDVTLPGAFGQQQFPVITTHDHHGIPIGRGESRETKADAIGDLSINLDIGKAKDWFSAIKYDLSFPKPLQEYSYAYEPVEFSFGEFEGEQVRFLAGIKIVEVSPVLKGAGINTRTLSAKGLRFSEHFEAVEASLKDARNLLERGREVSQMRAKEGRTLSRANRDRLSGLVNQLSEVRADIEKLLADSDPVADEDEGKVHGLLALYQKTQFEIDHVIGSE